jgi:hypothetical protein
MEPSEERALLRATAGRLLGLAFVEHFLLALLVFSVFFYSGAIV